MEPPTNLPRRATTLTRLWQRTDAADSIAQFLPTEALPVLPNIAKTFERDHWRLLGALMRRASRGTAAACRSAVLSTLQMTGRDTVHLREDWADQARFDEKWTVLLFRRAGAGEGEHVDYTATVSQSTLVLNRMTPRNSMYLVSRFYIPGIGDRCCVHRFRVALTYTPNNEETTSWGSGLEFANANSGTTFTSLFGMFIHHSREGHIHLRWRGGEPTPVQTLKVAPTRHTFLVDATLDWCTATARVTVDGAEFERSLPFRPVPVTALLLRCNDKPGQSTFGPVDVWYFDRPSLPSIRFEGEH